MCMDGRSEVHQPEQETRELRVYVPRSAVSRLSRRLPAAVPEQFWLSILSVYRSLFSVSLRITRDVPLAEDLAHESILRAYRKWDQYDSRRPFHAWMFTVLGNLCRDQLRSVWRTRSRSLEMAPLELSPSPEQQFEERQRIQAIRRSVRRLPARYAQAIEMRYLEAQSFPEMSGLTGVKEVTLRQRVRRGVKLLGEHWEG